MKKFKYKASDTRNVTISGKDVSLVKNKTYNLPSEDKYVKRLISLSELEEVIEVEKNPETPVRSFKKEDKKQAEKPVEENKTETI